MLESGQEKKLEVETSTKDTESAISSSEPPAPAAPPVYSAFPDGRKNVMLLLVTIAGFFGPLSGGIYLPALEVLGRDFKVSDGLINVTVSVFMVVFAIGVSYVDMCASDKKMADWLV